MLSPQVLERIRAASSSRVRMLLELQPDGPVHQHQVQPFDVGVGVAAVTRRGADAGHHQTDVVVVMQGAHGDTREGGYRADGLGVHNATIDPDVA